ncbi:MAG: hypothetical protein OHK0046_40810 [Anaerolineae bacterium]
MPDQTPEIDESLLGTAKIDPSEFNARGSGNKDRLQSAKYALAGTIYMFRREKAIRWLLVNSIILAVLVFWLRLETGYAALVVIAMGNTWLAEFINTAIEAVVDLATNDIHPMAKVAKDVASGISLVANVIAFLVVILVVLPPLLEKLR